MCAPQRQTIRTENFEQPNSPGAHYKAEQSADKGEKNRLNHHLVHHVPLARAHRLADGHFFRAAARANQKQVHEVNRANEQEEKYAALHQQECRTDGTHVIRMEWKHR